MTADCHWQGILLRGWAWAGPFGLEPLDAWALGLWGFLSLFFSSMPVKTSTGAVWLQTWDAPVLR